jgi:hypothetical protein
METGAIARRQTARVRLTLHEWETLEQFRAYASSDLMERIGKVLRPWMTTPPISRRLRTDTIEEVRG